MDDFVVWLRAQLDEDERTARATVWDGSGNRLDWELIASATIDVGGDEFYVGDRTIANHMMAWEPARVLREIAAKREAVVHYQRIFQEAVNGADSYVKIAAALGRQIRIMATVYADRPGYREEWRP